MLYCHKGDTRYRVMAYSACVKGGQKRYFGGVDLNLCDNCDIAASRKDAMFAIKCDEATHH